MKLPIKDEYYRMIKLGAKKVEFRDAHITFVNEKTGKQLVKNVKGVHMESKGSLSKTMQDLFDDDTLIAFELEEGCSECGHDRVHEVARCPYNEEFPNGDPDTCDCPGEELEKDEVTDVKK